MRKKPVSLPPSLDQALGIEKKPASTEPATPAPDKPESLYLSDETLAVASAAAQHVRRAFGITSSSWAWEARVPSTVIDRLLKSTNRRVTEEHLEKVIAALELTQDEFLALAEKPELTEEEHEYYWSQIKQNVGEWNLRTYTMGNRRPWRETEPR